MAFSTWPRTGAYALNLDAQSQGPFGPIRAIFAITVSLGKKMLMLSGVTYFGTMYFLLLTAILGPALWATGRIRIPNLLARPGWGLTVGLGNAVMIMTHVWAVSMTPATYMVSVKRLSLVFTVFYGRLMFKEAHFGERLLGVILMFVGVVLITWRG